MEPVQVIEHLGYTIKVFTDEDPTNPRKDFDHLGKILYVSSRYELGDEQKDTDTIQEIAERNDVIALPVYAYIHSGVVLGTSEFSCRWDSGQSGIIYCEVEDAKKEYPNLEDAEFDKVVRERLKAEVEEFSKYLSGEVYGFVITEPTGIQEHSCWGFYSLDDCIADAKAFADTTPIPQLCMTFNGTETTCTNCTNTGTQSCQ
jgi:hypothetical protein